MAHKKRPRLKAAPIPRKIPKAVADVESTDGQSIAWHVGAIDRYGPFGWESLKPETLWGTIHVKIGDFESMTWNDLPSQGSHPVPVAELCKEAQKRLQAIQQDDVENLFSLRLSGKQRIWGIRAGGIFKVLWWDPCHQVCPSKKKHT